MYSKKHAKLSRHVKAFSIPDCNLWNIFVIFFYSIVGTAKFARLKKRRRDRHLFGVSLVTSFPDSLSV